MAAGILATTLASCHNPVMDYEGDCTVHYYLTFKYDLNLKWADAFPSEVHSVNLYVFDNNGNFVKEMTAESPAVDNEGYRMELDMAPGNYTLIAWCGIGNPTGAGKFFTVPEPVRGQSPMTDLTCTLNTVESESGLSSSEQLDFMYHGMLEVDLPDSQDGASYYYTMPLTKDTNHIRIMLQQLSGDDMYPEDFSFIIEDSNGQLAHDNSLIDTPTVTYLPWSVDQAVAGIGQETENDSDDIIYAKGLVADFSVSRMMADHNNEFFLTVKNSEEEEIIARVPLIQYALLAKSYYEMAYGHEMDEQEFLDREDEYLFTFFLDEREKWIDTSILVQSWRIVLGDYGL